MGKYRFQLMIGSHAETVDGDLHTYDANERGNNIIETDSELDVKHGADKFRRISGDGTAVYQQVETPNLTKTEKTESGVELTAESLGKLTNKELVKLCEEQEINCEGVTKKEELINLLLS